MNIKYRHRLVETQLSKYINRNRAISLFGPRRVGKTTLLKYYMENQDEESIYFNGDEIVNQEILQPYSLENIKNLIGKKKLIIIDEAQKVKNIENTIKLIVDNLSNVQLLVTGSNSLNLGKKIRENLTGRIIELYLNSFTMQEIYKFDNQKILGALNHHLVYGTYPYIQGEDIEFQEKNLKDLVEKYLVQDLQHIDQAFNPILMMDLLKLLAYSVGSEITYNSLSRKLEVNKETIQRYLSILEKSYIIFRIYPYKNNPTKTISRIRKVYFYDNGLRNALLSNFQPISVRQDTGAVFENFIFSEVYKTVQALGKDVGIYYWRSNKSKEVDLVLKKKDKFFAYEMKFSREKFLAPASIFRDLNLDSVEVLNKNNFFNIYNKLD